MAGRAVLNQRSCTVAKKQESYRSNPVTLAAAISGAFQVVAARIAAGRARADYNDNNKVVEDVHHLAAQVLEQLDELTTRR